MKTVISLGLCLAALLLLSTPSNSMADSCRASVVHGSGAIQAELSPCDFTIPSGTTAVNLSCFRADPASNWSSDALCKVYSVTEGRDMTDANGNPVTSLPPGTYRFTVGGHPGAYGTFSWDLQ